METAEGPWRLDGRAAGAYMTSRILGISLKALHCPLCHELHTDLGEFAVEPHRRHQCNACGRHFHDKGGPGVANACCDLRRLLQPPAIPAPIPATRSLRLRQRDLAGLELWGSNEAIVWTAPVAEETGIHVHAYDLGGQMVTDETFASLSVDGIRLDPVQLRTLMAQKALPLLRGRVCSLECPTCGVAQFDQALDAARPGRSHTCSGCSAEFMTRRRVVFNPMVGTLQKLSERPRGRRRRRAA